MASGRGPAGVHDRLPFRIMLDPIDLARTLIGIPSITGEESEHGLYLSSLLRELGFEVEHQEIAPARLNIFASGGGVPRVILCSHLDTVPPFFGLEETDDDLIGRGACDTKGIIASMVAAGEALRSSGVRDFAFLLVVGEETDSIGAKRANEHFAGRGSKFVVLGEPTESKFVRASKGALTCAIEFSGVAAHSAYPERGESAIRKLARAVEAIYEAEWGDDAEMGKGTPNVGVVRGGAKANIIPAHAEAECIFRIVEPVEQALRRLEGIVGGHGGTIVRWHGNDPVRMVHPPGVETTVVSFNTDAPHLRTLGAPVLFGPGSILDAHTARERIAKREIIAAVETYRTLVSELLRGAIEKNG